MHDDLVVIDGSFGEGGGQILRTALALSLVTRRPLQIDHIRANREKPGLRPQHLAAVLAAAEVGEAVVEGADIGSQALSFEPKTVRPGDYHFAVGTAGSATLVLQTVLPALLTAAGASRLALEGGTHNPLAPPVDFLLRTFLPLVERMGPKVDVRLERHGFYPAGGGHLTASVEPVRQLEPLTLDDRGPVRAVTARALVSQLPRSIAERELAVVSRRLNLAAAACVCESISDSPGPGNAVLVAVESEHLTEVFAGFGEKRIPAETVAADLVGEVRDYLLAEVPVGPYLADQLLVPMALAGAGSFRTVEPTLHARTNGAVIERFLGVSVRFHDDGRRVWHVEVRPRH